jgi:predicted small lipoprotein YifL
MRRLITIAACLALAGCGLREPLRPADGQSLPPAPAHAERALTPDELLAVPSEFRRLRVDEPLTRSERRPVDRFDLPPTDISGAAETNQSELEERPNTSTSAPQ